MTSDIKTYTEFDLFLTTVQTLFMLFALAMTLVYIAFMWRYIWGWWCLPFFQKNKKTENTTTISVLIPARNEEKNLSATLHAIIAQNYPANLYEIIVIDDHSTDNTTQIIIDFCEKYPNVKLIRLAEYIDADRVQSFKKKAIEIGVQKSDNQLIVQTDADCIMGKDWLKIIADYYEQYQSKFIAAPVIFFDEKNTFQRFQSLAKKSPNAIPTTSLSSKIQPPQPTLHPSAPYASLCSSASVGQPKRPTTALLWIGLTQLVIKIILDYIFLASVANSFNRKDLVSMSVYIPSIFLELTYIIVIGLLGLFVKKYEWKGRRVQ